MHVERRTAVIAIVHPRKTMPLRAAELRFLLRLVKEVHLGPDYADALSEIIDLSAPDGNDRILRQYRSNVAAVADDKEFRVALERFATAHDALVESGFEVPDRPVRRPPEYPDLFEK